MLRVAMICYSS